MRNPGRKASQRQHLSGRRCRCPMLRFRTAYDFTRRVRWPLARSPAVTPMNTSSPTSNALRRSSTCPGCRMSKVPPRQSDGFEDKYRFVRYVERTEGIAILGLARQDRQLMKEPDQETPQQS